MLGYFLLAIGTFLVGSEIIEDFTKKGGDTSDRNRSKNRDSNRSNSADGKATSDTKHDRAGSVNGKAKALKVKKPKKEVNHGVDNRAVLTLKLDTDGSGIRHNRGSKQSASTQHGNKTEGVKAKAKVKGLKAKGKAKARTIIKKRTNKEA